MFACCTETGKFCVFVAANLFFFQRQSYIRPVDIDLLCGVNR